MNRALFLLLIVNCLQADPMADLEKAIMKSDLPAMEKLVASDISISMDEKAALINLATEIIRKCENKIFINNIPTICKKYLENNCQLKTFMNRFAELALLALIIPLAGVVALDHYLEDLKRFIGGSTDAIYMYGSIAALTISCTVLGAALCYGGKYNTLVRKLIINHNKKYNNQRDGAIQIRQMLYKIKVQ